MADPDEVVGTIDKLAEHVCNYSVNEVFPDCFMRQGDGIDAGRSDA